jgi:hypothetical protein
MAGLSEHQAALARLRREREATREAVLAARARVDAARAEVERLRRQVAGNERLRHQLEAAEQALAGERAAVERARERLGVADATIRDRLHEVASLTPQRLVESLDDAIPFLLLPVRIETRFFIAGRARELRVRIFPDDVAVTTHDRALAEAEVDAGQTFWRERARAGALDEVERRNADEGAWTLLVYRHGEHRAAWIARQTRPTNWNVEHSPAPDALVFPDPGPTRPESAGSTPRSMVMPDRFVVMTFSSDTDVVHEVVGQPIPDDLVLGPDPLQLESVLTRDATTGRIVADARLAWLFDFDAAEAVGLAVRIPLEAPWHERGFHRVLVLGLRLTTDAADAAARVEALIEGHRFTRGFDLVPQGTPTNNTEGSGSGFTSDVRAGIDDLGAAVEEAVAVGAVDHPAKTDAQRLAEALGIDFDGVKALPSATRRDIGEALAMNRALWGATLGAFVRNFVTPLVPPARRTALERFFLTFVTGRGLLPAIRVGRQPYGVLVTSAIDPWTWARREVGDDEALLQPLLDGARRLTRRWRELASAVARVVPDDPDGRAFIGTVGLHASSIAYAARKAVTDEHAWNALHHSGLRLRFIHDFWADVTAKKTRDLTALGLDPNAAELKLRELTFVATPDELDAPVVDGDPALPLSETARLTSFDGTRNYIDWLTTASWDDLEAERFTAADGQAVPAPRALLYRYLRHASLAELRVGAIPFLRARLPEVFTAVEAERPVVNVGPDKTLTHGQLLAVDAARVGAANLTQPVGDFLLDRARRAVVADLPPEALALASLTDSLRALAGLPTARLERLFAEHVDVCGYRLDAWHLGLFARRLDGLRRREGGERGIYLGAWGVVESLSPSRARRTPVDPATLPEPLREPGVTVVERDDNGGYVHAPSLTHAVTAAVLRNAYLTHADRGRPGAMSVNLSSARVRHAMAFIEGLRNGHELGALLGYHLERGLHERHPGVELDALIYVLRERFPLVSRKLTPVPDGVSAEVIEARNVINGYDLLEHVRDTAYPYGIAGLPPATGGSPADAERARAIVAEIDALAEAMDALADLLLAESVHQVVQGNYDRARGVLQALGEGEVPPIPEVAATPRSGRSLTQRVAIVAPDGAGWTGNPPTTPRAAANARLNRWLVTMLPAPATLQVRFTLGAGAPDFVSLADLGLDALDVVLMSGDALGDASSELERAIVDHFRASRAVGEDVRVFFRVKSDPAVPEALALVVDPGAAAPGAMALETVLALLRWLRGLASSSRALHAGDFRLPTEAHLADPANPKGLDGPAPPLQDLADLAERVNVAIAALDAARAPLVAVAADPAVSAAHEALLADPSTFAAPFWAPHLATIRTALRQLTRFGISEALPASAHGTTGTAVTALVPQMHTGLAIVAKHRAEAAALAAVPPPVPPPADPAEAARARARLIDTRAERLGEAARTALGRSMVMLPLFAFGADQHAEVSGALTAPVSADPMAIETWLQSAARVRAPVGALAWVASSREWLAGAPLRLTPIQFPVRAGDPWIGGAVGGAALPDDVLSVVIVHAPGSAAGVHAGLMIDDWTEVVPTARETTGLAFHFNRPNAVAPQALLVAVAPVLKGHWTWSELVQILTDTLDRARLRAVEPDHLLTTEFFQALPTTLVEFSSGRTFLSTLLVESALVMPRLGTP